MSGLRDLKICGAGALAREQGRALHYGHIRAPIP